MQFHMNSMSSDEYRHLRDSSRYQATTLVGNWNEERELRRSNMRSLLMRKATGTLKLDAFGQKMSVALADVELTKVADDPYVHFGDVLQLVHLETGSVLAVDVSERDARPGEEACATSGASECRAPCARNALIILKYTPPKNSPLEPDYGDGVVRYGQKVRIAFHPLNTGDDVNASGGKRPLCLFSKPVSTTHSAKYCRNQLVGATFRTTYDTVWQIMTPEPALRNASEGVEVLAGAPIILMHCQTQKALLLENQRYPNDFGVEWELSARNDATHGLKSALEQSEKGLLKGTLPKSGQAQNLWVFMTGSKIATLPVASGQLDAFDAAAALVASLPADGVALLERKIVTHSNQKSELLAEDFVLLVRQCKSELDNSHIYSLATPFLTSKPGVMDARDFLAAFRAAAGTA